MTQRDGNKLQRHTITLDIPEGKELKLKSLEILITIINYKLTAEYKLLNPSYKHLIKLLMEYTFSSSVTIHSAVTLLLKYKWLHRVFTDSFNQGGRFFGASWINLSSELRSMLLIDEERVTELDYSGMHLRMIYHLEGIDYKDDPYGDVGPEARNLYKLALLVLINSSSHRKYQAVRKAFLDKGYKGKILTKQNIVPIIESLENRHYRIAQYFASDQGIKLMYLESEIASDIIRYFLERDIPVLPIHDSFIIQAKHVDLLKDAMERCYEKRMGFKPIIH